MTERILLNHKETADYLNISIQTLYNWRHCRKGPNYIMLGRKPMYHIRDIESYLESNRVVLEDHRI